ncbi:CHAD domain-containing protein [Oryzomonas sagensis]|uniref:CHAD domain-containing protein n=1 Tax=Oryzomonas sagensis TaxID=2603857 RepID=A0ABQ6TU69_9BACT|nr:CHAD domain-containing protein [Oryzomonas sagensis]KAB0672460.1 CHAD domain-containing protein [Oryzomonas sagensis]
MPEPDDSRENYRERAAAVVRARWKGLLKNREACLRCDAVDAVHDLRVSTRRLRAALDFFGALCPGDEAPRARPSIRRLTRGIGELRNLDEGIIFFSRNAPDKRGTGDTFAPLLLHLRARRESEALKVRRLLKKLDTARMERVIDRYAAWVREPADGRHRPGAPTSIPAYFSEEGLRLYGEICRHLPGALVTENVQNRHALRIAVKRWRYFLEIAAEIFPQDYRETLELLKEYQQLLGDLNDLRVFGAFAHEAPLAPDGAAALDALVARLTANHLEHLALLLEQRPIRYQFSV